MGGRRPMRGSGSHGDGDGEAESARRKISIFSDSPPLGVSTSKDDDIYYVIIICLSFVRTCRAPGVVGVFHVHTSFNIQSHHYHLPYHTNIVPFHHQHQQPPPPIIGFSFDRRRRVYQYLSSDGQRV